jgi:hypothetical protein
MIKTKTKQFLLLYTVFSQAQNTWFRTIGTMVIKLPSFCVHCPAIAETLHCFCCNLYHQFYFILHQAVKKYL